MKHAYTSNYIQFSKIHAICKIYLRIYFFFFQDVTLTFACRVVTRPRIWIASFDSFSSTKFPLEMVETKMKKVERMRKKGRVYRFAGYRFRCGETTPGNDERPCVPLEDKSFVFPRYSSPVIYFDSVLLLLFIIWTSVHLTHHRSTKGGNTRDAHSQPEESFHRLRS